MAAPSEVYGRDYLTRERKVKAYRRYPLTKEAARPIRETLRNYSSKFSAGIRHDIFELAENLGLKSLPDRYTKEQKMTMSIRRHLKRYEDKSFALAKNVDTAGDLELELAATELEAAVLEEAGMVEENKTIGIRPIIPRNSSLPEQEVGYIESSYVLAEIIEAKTGKTPFVQANPIRPRDFLSNPYRAFDQALTEFEQSIPEDKLISAESLGFIAIVDGGLAVRAIPDLDSNVMSRYGAAVLTSVDPDRPHHRWLPETESFSESILRHLPSDNPASENGPN